MATIRDARAGVEPGLRFAMLMPPGGGVTELGWHEIDEWRPERGFLWVHLERDDPAAQAWLNGRAGLDRLVALALMADESRPRVEAVDDDLMIVLRGVNRCATETETCAEAELVPLHIWAEAGRVITLRDKAHSLEALHDLRMQMLTGKGPRSTGALLARIADKVVDHLGDLTSALEEELSELEETVGSSGPGSEVRGAVTDLRRRIVTLRRYLLPQRDALFKLRQDDATWLNHDAKLNLREVSERLGLHLDDLDEMRQRATLLHEEMDSKVAEQTSRNTFVLSIVTVLMLPATFVTGFFGMNTGDLPFNGAVSHGTWFAALLILAAAAGTGLAVGLFLRRKSSD
ncbi:CorA family divalent cation transporter [Magnetospirillum sp. UT-4]|uniref:CorA family divalent cation transporter n=1 Tax=Magnetospirillum sp. UT-4 TaxID=2681467 RepID=UPI001385FD05|nr:CorA family divalent cation transporter [Magnetospirillum sp. UT-4]CAA7615277.1 Mg2+ and Co2+ transporter [Magnetospirillum sp. UT-4]